MRRLFLFLLIVELAHCLCPSGFDVVLDRECSGNITRTTVPAEDAINVAIAKCMELGTHPIIIHNDDQQNYWPGRVYTTYTVIGLVCDTNSKNWIWADGSALDFKPTTYASNLDKDCTLNAGNPISWMISTSGVWTYYGSTVMFTTDIFCSKQLPPLPVPSLDGCDSFADDIDDGVCYQVGATAENWQDAQMICRKLGANLASIHNGQENSFIRRLAVSKGAVTGVYLGASLSGKGKEFGWIDGSDWDYSNFHSGFPIPGIGDCLAMDTSTSSGLWMNIDCSEKHPVACIREKKTVVVVDPVCGDGPWAEDQIITSPGFPYNASIPCEFFIGVEVGKNLELEIVLVEANTGHDYLVLTDGFIGGHVVANLTGALNNVTYTTTNTNVMKVSWEPNGGTDVLGVAFSYRAV